MLLDYRVSKKLDGATFTLCGNPEYISPEQIWATGQSFAVDWWCLGVTLYEMLMGHTPWVGPEGAVEEVEVFKRISEHSVNVLAFDDSVSIEPGLKDLIKQLLHPNPDRRLGENKKIGEIRKHPFFAGTEWEKMVSILHTGVLMCHLK